MQKLTEDLFLSVKFTLPYTHDKNTKDLEENGRDIVSLAVRSIKKHFEKLRDNELYNALIFLAVNLESHPWNSRELVNHATQLYNSIITKNLSECHFFSENPGFCKMVNKWITSYLKRDSWQNYAIIVVLYKWYCFHLTFPSVSDNLELLLVPSLLLVDSYDDELKETGVRCLCHIISESGKTELRWHGRAQVIFDAFYKLTYTHHQPLVAVLHPGILKILHVLEGDPAAAAVSIKYFTYICCSLHNLCSNAESSYCVWAGNSTMF